MRRTLKNKTEMTGIGLHKGRPSTVVFLPAKEPTGIRFLKPGLTDPITACLDNIAATVRGTNISDGKRMIYTVEHILSACAGLGIDDLDVALDGEEPPAADGSALPFARALKEAGIEEKPGQERRFLTLKGPVELSFGKAFYKASSSVRPSFKMTFSHPHPFIGEQTFGIDMDPERYLTEVAPARTFGFKSEITGLKAAGLALGGSLENAVIIDDAPPGPSGKEDVFLSAEGRLRFPDELVRHKLLDLMGDLALTGLALDRIAVEASCTGHKSNINFAKLLIQNAA